MFNVKHKDTGVVVMVYAVQNLGFLIYDTDIGFFRWADSKLYEPA